MRLVDHNIVFLSVQKAGSTAVRQFLEANYAVDKFDNSHYTRTEILDKGLAKPTDTFIGVVREPLERQLSRFLYQAKHGIYKDRSIDGFPPMKPGSIDGFRQKIINGNGCLPNYKRAVDYEADVWWLYTDLDKIIDLPRVNLTGNLPTDQWMVSQFYNDHTRELATEYHKADIELLAQLAK